MTNSANNIADELNTRLDELNDELEAVVKEITKENEESRREGEQNLAALEAMDLDAEMEPIEEEAIQELEKGFAEALKDVDEQNEELARDEANLGDDEK